MKSGSAPETVAHVLAPDVSYDRRTIQLHWVTAALVGLLWAIAQIVDFFPKGSRLALYTSPWAWCSESFS